MSSSDSGESNAPAFGGIHFTLGGAVQVGAPGYSPSPELMSLANAFMPYLANRMRENNEARDQQAHGSMETDGKNDGKGQEDPACESDGGNDGLGKAGASSSTAKDEPKQEAAPKQAMTKKKQRSARRARRARSTDTTIGHRC